MSKTKTPVPAEDVTLTYFELRDAVQIGIPTLSAMEPAPVARIGMRIAKLNRVMTDELKEFVDAGNALIKEYGEKNDKGDLSVETDNPRHGEWQEKYQDLGKAEVTVAVRKVVLPAECTPNPIALCALEKFVTIRGWDEDEDEDDSQPAAPAGPTEVVKTE